MVILITGSLKELSIVAPILQLIRTPATVLADLHQKYGDLFLVKFFTSRLLFVRKPEHIEEIYQQEAKGILNRDFLYEAKKILFGDGLVNSKQDIWPNQRRLMQPLFTKEAVMVWQSLMINEAKVSIENIKLTPNAKINLSQEIQDLVQRIFVQFLFGKETKDDTGELRQAIATISKGLATNIVMDAIGHGWLKWLFYRQVSSFRQAIKKMEAFVDGQIELKSKQPGLDMVSLLMAAEDTKSGYVMTRALLKDEAMDLLFAGLETTINSLNWLFYSLEKNPEFRQKIIAEVKDFSFAGFCQDSLLRLPYTRAAIQETMRLYPPAAGLATQAIQDTTIAGYPIKKGAILLMNMFATHRHPAYWDKPDEYRPERFLSDGQAIKHRYAYFPFAGGLHNCLGRHLAELEMLIIVTTFFQHYDFDNKHGYNEALTIANGITLKPSRDLIFQLTERQHQ